MKEIFWEEDAANILAIPMHTDREDSVAWHFDKKGVFLVKSAYHVLEDDGEARRVRQTGESSSATSDGRSRMWKKIWHLPGSLKLKHIVWRIAHNSLPLKMNIKAKGIALDAACLCSRFDEDGAHCFVKCKEFWRRWRELGLEDVRLQLAMLDRAEEFVTTILQLKPDICIMVCVLLWRWWEIRNKVNAGELMQSSPAIVVSVINTA